MLSKKRIKEAERNFKSYLTEGLIKKKKCLSIWNA